MKKQLIYIFLTCTIMSCSKEFTDLSPISQRNVASFYRNGDDMTLAVNAAYKALQLNGTYNQSYWVLNEMRSDNTDAGADLTGLGADLNLIDQFAENAATAELITAAYLNSYVGIARCNLVLSRIDAVPMADELRNRLKGESLFLRSLFYYNLAVNFGKIPLVLKEITVAESPSYPQVPATEVYRQLVTDLTMAESFLPLRKDLATKDIGRATKGSAAALLGKVLLTMGNKTEAVPVLRRIISSYGYTLVKPYSSLWGVANENNQESIFEVQFKGGGTNTGNLFTNQFSAVLKNNTGGFKNGPTVSMEAAYEPGDQRLTASMNPTNGPLSASRFIIKYGTTTNFNEGDADYNFIVLRYADVLLMLAEALGESGRSLRPNKRGS